MNRHTNIVASYLVLKKDTKVLLLLRENTGYRDGEYSLIAGHVEVGESFTSCIIREAKEEAGILVTDKDLKVAHVLHRKSVDDKSERVDVFFVATSWHGKVENNEPEKCGELCWFDLDKLPNNCIPYIRSVLDKMQASLCYSESGWNL